MNIMTVQIVVACLAKDRREVYKGNSVRRGWYNHLYEVYKYKFMFYIIFYSRKLQCHLDI